MRFRVGAGIMLLAWSGAVAGAQKITTVEELTKVMKKAGPAMQASQKGIASNAFGDVKMQLATLKQAVLDSQTFWIENKREDALKFNKDTLAKIESAEQAVAAEPVDPVAAAAAVKAVGAACRSCHQVYRATDADNNFILKPGSLGGG